MHSKEFGTIWEWSGLISAIPPGFVVCDGTKGTPDLRDRFIVGAGNGFAVNEVGGVTIHNHPFTGDGHIHAIAGGLDISEGEEIDNNTSTDPVVGTTDNGTALARYYALIYLQLQK